MVNNVYAQSEGNLKLPDNRMFLGIYDPANSFPDQNLDVEEYFIPPDLEQLNSVLTDAENKKRVPIVTIEWSCPDASDSQNVLQKMAKGEYDKDLSQLANIMSNFPGKVIVRLFHEMELPDLYCWGKGSPTQFIIAFRHARDIFRHATNVIWVWSPAGNNNAGDYYPGDYYVDYIGFTLLASDEWDRLFGVYPPQSFRKLMDIRWSVLSKFGKPMFIAEFGIARPTESERVKWLKAALSDIQSKRYRLIGVVFFNAPNAANTHTGSSLPHWEISSNMLWKISEMPPIRRQ